MIERIRRLKRLVMKRFPASRLELMKPDELNRLRKEYPILPEHLELLFREFGFGCIGESRYMLFGGLIPPEDICDPATAHELAGVVIVAHDFWEHCEAYNT